MIFNDMFNKKLIFFLLRSGIICIFTAPKTFVMMKYIFSIVVFFAFLLPVDATHYMGGEITWECLPNGNYRFTAKLYRECYTTNGGNAAQFGNIETMYTTVPGLPSFTMTRVSLTDMSPQCNPNPIFQPKIFCPGMSNGNANMGALQENIYTSDATYPNGVTLNGVPPPGGWEFSMRTCCRNPCANITNASSLGFRLRAKMYSYNGQNANPCFDSSPVFAERPSTVITIGYPFKYNHNAFDPDLDSLVYEWGQPLLENGSPIVAYTAGYSYDSPLPGTMHHPNNVPGVVNPNTGEITFTSYTQGAFVTVIKVSTYRCGVLIAEIFREMQVVLLANVNNSPPNVEAPFQNPVTGLFTEYTKTVCAGELITFSITGTDFELMSDNLTPQTLKIEASGMQFGTGYTNPNAGCLYPPCATLNPPPPVFAQFGVITNFSWQTACEHIATDMGCGTLTNTYNFLIKVMDDYCPAPAINFNTVTVVVVDCLMDPPEPRCVETLSNGDVQITWLPPSQGLYQLFDSYHIFYSPNFSGPYTVVDSIFNLNQTSWTHTGANGNNQQGYYYMMTRSGCGLYFSPSTDTISNILLEVSNPGTGVAQLAWNPTKDPLIPTNSPMYLIYRDAGTGTMELIDSTTNLFYTDTIVFCDEFVTYQIHQYDSSGCYNISNIDGDDFSDVIPPDTPFLDYATVDLPSQKAIINWQASNAPDVVGYIIYRFAGGVWSPLDTIPDLTYQDLTGFPDLNYEAYRVASIDSCGNTSPMSLEHRTIFLTTAKDICDDEIILTWTSYINLSNSLVAYEIYFSINGDPYQFLADVGPSETTYFHTGLLDSTQYCYYVMAVNDDGTKTPMSNFRCESALKPYQPQFAYIRYVSVVDNDYVEIAMFTDTTAKVSGYRLEKALNNSGQFSLVANLPPSLSPLIYYEDANVEVDRNIYTYRFIVRDSCDVDAITSNEATTILLTGGQGNELFSNKLLWTDYDGWPTGVAYYEAYRGTSEFDLFDFVAQVPFGINYYLDVFSDDFGSSDGKLRYYVVGFENPGNPYGFNESSTSNIVTIIQPPNLFVPNAFTPGGTNPVFMPVMLFMDKEDYYFAIYDRWGQEIFQTYDINQGWDGTFKGNIVQTGVYTWILKAKYSNGIKVERRGVVTLLR
jgi:gliding motility-associated-like protein